MFIFCQLYYGIGIEHLDGITGSDGEWNGQAYFLVPKPLPLLVMDTSALQVFDQFTLFGRGFDRFIKFRNTAGLFFGRFSRPIAFFEIFA
jgi:inward rectifier potassium channel